MIEDKKYEFHLVRKASKSKNYLNEYFLLDHKLLYHQPCLNFGNGNGFMDQIFNKLISHPILFGNYCKYCVSGHRSTSLFHIPFYLVITANIVSQVTGHLVVSL
jgi:hypothetical protein